VPIVYWLQRPPYLRWAAAALLVIGSFAWEARRPAREPAPFAGAPIAAGEPLTASNVQWRPVRKGLLPIPDLEGAVAAVPLSAGDPIIPATISGAASPPPGWWTVAIEGVAGPPGAEVLLVTTEPAGAVVGVLLAPARGDVFSLDHTPALVAVPPDAAALIAAAAGSGRLVAATRT